MATRTPYKYKTRKGYSKKKLSPYTYAQLRAMGAMSYAPRRSYPSTAELKFFDTTDTFGTVDAAGEIKNSLNLIPQGTDEDERVGRKCTIKSISIRGDFEYPEVNAVQGLTSDRCRVIVYLDKQANGATAAVTDILETADILSFRNLANTQRFWVLSDKVVNIAPSAGAGNVGGADSNWAATFKTYSFNKRCNIPLEFSAAVGVITELRSNNIGILAIAENGGVVFKYSARIRFSDS